MNLLLELWEAIGLVTPAVERHVSATGDDTYDGSVKTPYRTIQHALDANAGRPAGRKLSLTLHGALTESVTLGSLVSLKGPATLTSATAGPAITIAGTAAARVTDVTLSKLIVNGLDPYTGDGGTVLVRAADRVTIDQCELRGGVAGRGAGLAILDSTAVKVSGCKIHDNVAGTPTATLAGADLKVLDGVVLPTGNGHGGGVFTSDSDVQISGCDVFENQAILAGGGIAIRNQARTDAVVTVSDCQVTCNQVSHPPLGTLAAPMSIKAADIGDPIFTAFDGIVSAIGHALPGGNDAHRLVALLHGLNFESGMGGGISMRNTTATRITKCHIGVTRAGVEGANRGRRGGGISCYIGAYPTIDSNEIANNVSGGDGGGVGIDQFDPILPPGKANAFGITAIPMVPRLPVNLTGNAIHDNGAMEDGGGVYCSGNVQLVIQGGVVKGNRSVEDGGGVRATFASNMFLENVKVTANQANVDSSGSDGGGGVSSRNADVTLRSCELTDNIVNAFGGGAIYFSAMFEGGIESVGIGSYGQIPYRVANKHGTFDQMMEDLLAYHFHTRILRIVDCRGSGNKATGTAGAGGFLYAVRQADRVSPMNPLNTDIFGGIEAMWVDIEGSSTAIGANTSEHTNASMRKRGNVVIELSGMTTGAPAVPMDRVWIGPEIAAGAIAQPIPATPAPQARAVLVTTDTNAAHDIPMLTWPAGGFSFGPVPVITGVTPAVASTLGNTLLTIDGSGFDPTIEVLLGAEAGIILTNSATSLVVPSNPGPPGPIDVTVISPSGARTTLHNAVTLVHP